MELLKIWLLSIAAAVVYGILHDQVTARVCIEYFTVFHPPVFATNSPTLLALGWGVIATWWMGAILGLPLAVFARIGDAPKLKARDLIRPLAFLLLCMGIVALCAGIAGACWANAQVSAGHLPEPILPAGKQVAFIADRFAHNASYLGGALGCAILCLWAAKKRGMSLRSSQ